MKKFFIIFLASLMVLSFAACGGKGETGDTTTTAPAGSTESTAQPTSTEAPTTTESASESTAPVEAALIPGVLFQLDAENPVVRGLTLTGNRSGTWEFNNVDPAAEGIRCIFETNEWVEFFPDTDAKEGLAVWAFTHRDDPKEYASLTLSEETEGYAAYSELKLDPEAEEGTAWGSFYLHTDYCEAGYYDLVFTLNGKATAVLLTRFYNEPELELKTDAELVELMKGLK